MAKGKGARRAKTKPDGDPAETTQPALPNMPSERDILHHLQNIKHYEDKAATARGHLADAKKKAKEAGIDLQALKLSMGFARSDTLDISTMLNQLSKMMAIQGLPVQMHLYDARYSDPEAQAKVEGFQDGKACKTPNAAKYPEGSPFHAAYMASWMEGSATNVKGAPSAAEQAARDKDFEAAKPPGEPATTH